jgi:hypothetical protein
METMGAMPEVYALRLTGPYVESNVLSCLDTRGWR